MLANARSDNLRSKTLVRIISAQTQVVAGVKYTLVLDAGTSVCNNRYGLMADLEECPLAPGAQTETYEAEIWWQAWRNPPYKLMKFERKRN